VVNLHMSDTLLLQARPVPDTRALAIGLLVLRVGIGAAVLQAALIKLGDFSATVGFMTEAGWRLPMLAALMVTTAEALGGLGLLVGLLTPLAGCAVLSAMACAWAVNVSAAAVWADPFNVPFLLGLGAAALVFTGAGRFGVDVRLQDRLAWSLRVKAALVVLAFVAAVGTWMALYGVNPIHFGTP
jgi:putative oxidoreductase